MTKGLKKGLVWFSSLALAGLVAASVLVGSGPGASALAAGPLRSDFALLDQEPTVKDVSVQCGAVGNANQAVPFVIHITMTNRGDSGLGGTNGFVRTTYHDGDFVDYAIPVNTTVQISLAGGGTLGVDDAVKVTNAGSGAVLIGQISLIANAPAKPLPLISPIAFCTTTTALGGPSPF